MSQPKSMIPFADLVVMLADMDTASFCDIRKDELRVMSHEIRPVSAPRILGRARTVSVLDDFLTVIKALHEAEPGEVLVIDGRGGDKALLGELFCAEAQRKQLAGIVVDGACRDVKGIKALPFPVFSRHVTPMAGTCKKLFETQTGITCGGVSVEPGDIIFADEDGLVVMSDQELLVSIESARRLQEMESQVLQSITSGTPLLGMTNAEEHLKAVFEGKESKLCFNIGEETHRIRK